jgi:hypothetical protein
MRFVYVDESGISSNESVVVVAGVVIDADSQWKSVESQISKLIEKHVREEDREGFCFHAKELFHGSGKVFGKREKYPLERSREALRELLAIPVNFGLPIVFGWSRKEDWMYTATTRKGQLDEMAHEQAMAFSFCAIAAESYMVKDARAGEIATIVAENNADTHRTVKRVHNILRGRKRSLRQFVTVLGKQMGLSPEIMPLKRIIDTVYFAEKDDAFLLQIADACAFIIRYFIEEKSNVDDFLDAFTNGHPENIGDREKMKRFPAGLNWLVPEEVDENK